MPPSGVRSGHGLDYMYNAEDVRSVAHQSQARLFNHPSRLAIPMTAKCPNLPAGQSILQPAEEPNATPAMFEEQNAALRLADTSHLTQHRQRIRKGAGAHRRRDGIEVIVRERERFTIHQMEINRSAQLVGPLARDVEHPPADINGGEAAITGIIREVPAGTRRDLQHIASRAAEQATSQAVEQQPFEEPLGAIVASSYAIVLLSNFGSGISHQYPCQFPNDGPAGSLS
jgi:hypothetical protein